MSMARVEADAALEVFQAHRHSCKVCRCGLGLGSRGAVLAGLCHQGTLFFKEWQKLSWLAEKPGRSVRPARGSAGQDVDLVAVQRFGL